ncbi:hypothetical protein AALP_AA3G050700 [Arabis alpina]|uniref:Cystatin domain-containing protein n=1 Tax=Arabis alpina TaxID=50452 RepID=A0A087H746_ARAAL|nr:hypothetical protein AALP_AA3G050700 [Arabis alpina]
MKATKLPPPRKKKTKERRTEMTSGSSSKRGKEIRRSNGVMIALKTRKKMSIIGDCVDELETQWRHYTKQLYQTKGFFETTDKFPPRLYAGTSRLGDLDKPCAREFRVYSETIDMAPKSSDGEIQDEYSGVMETSTDVASPLLGKRKVEFSTPEDSSESEGDRQVEEDVVDGSSSAVEVEEDDREVDSDEIEVEEDSETDWDKDSFDGVEYNPSDDDGEYSDEEFHQKCVSYHRAVITTKGFFEESDDYPPYLWTGIVPVPDLDEELKDGMTTREFIGNMAVECVKEFNKRNNKTLKYERVLRANFNPGGRTTYYINIEAKECDSPNAPLVEYQAKAIWSAGDTYPILCRPSPSPK